MFDTDRRKNGCGPLTGRTWFSICVGFFLVVVVVFVDEMVDGWRLIRFSCSFVTTVHLTPCVSIDLLIWAHRIDCVRPLAVVCHPATYYHHHFGKIFIKDVRGRVAADNDFICRHVLLLSLHSKRGKQQKEILSATHRLKLDATKIENQTRKFVLLPLWHDKSQNDNSTATT